ncbi:MAG: hypothetical protein WBY94_26765 [Polyangiaceae bacterium]
MSGAGSRAKGARAENEVAKLLQEWWRQLEPGCTFKRTPSSGGWAHGEARRDFKTSGDLTTTAALFPWVVEVKRREGWSRKTFEAGRPSPVWGWWLQAQAQAREQGATPMLWLRRSRDPWLVLVPERSAAMRYDERGVPDIRAGHTISIHRATMRWRGRWPRARGERPIAVQAVCLLAEHPRGFAVQGQDAKSSSQEAR